MSSSCGKLATPSSLPFVERLSKDQNDHQKHRSAFDRDRDRVIHSGAFRRLAHKTQVVFDARNDHSRTRLTHSIETSQIARSLARNFNVNEALTEAISLAHDMGHPPFGHTGENALKEALKNEKISFNHNDQTLRVLLFLEHPYVVYGIKGLNLTHACIEGIAKHNGPLTDEQSALAPSFVQWREENNLPINLAKQAGLEAQIAAIADDIAYLAHDLDDALRYRLITIQEIIKAVPMVGDVWKSLLEETTMSPSDPFACSPLIRRLITKMIEDVHDTTEQRLEAFGIGEHGEIINCDEKLVSFSEENAPKTQELKTYLNKHYWNKETTKKDNECFAFLVGKLYEILGSDTDFARRQMEEIAFYHPQIESSWDNPDTQKQIIVDYIAGMTDRFALATCKKLEGLYPCKELSDCLEVVSSMSITNFSQ